MSVDFFANDVVRGDNNSGSEMATKYTGSGAPETPDLFKDDPKPEVKKEETPNLADAITKVVKESSAPELIEDEEGNLEVKVEKEEAKEEIKEGKEEKEVKELKASKKQIIAKSGDNEFKLSPTSKIKHKVDGKEVEVELQDLLNNFSGKTAWDKKYSELDGERKSHKKDLEVVNNYMNKFAEISQKDRVKGLEFLAEQVGFDPLEYRRGLRQELMSHYETYSGMDENERKYFEQQEELEYLKSNRESEVNNRNRQQAQEDLANSYRKLEQSHGINDSRLGEIAEALQKAGVQDLSPEVIIETHNLFVTQDRAYNVLGKVNPEFAADNSKLKMIESLVAGNSSISDDELYQYVSKLWGSDVQVAVASVQKKNPPKEPQKAQTWKPKQKSNNYVDFFDE